MWEEILKAIPVYFATMLKFIFGPLGGYTAGLNLLTTILTTVFGMMSVVFLFTYSGDWFKEKVLHRFMRKRDPSSAKNRARDRKLARIWKKYGLTGIALLTPIILTPIGGTLLAVSSGSPKEKIIFYMFISAAAWAVIFSVSIYFFGNEILPDFIK
jgi:membrane protein DedA with SNARE-associated domain